MTISRKAESLRAVIEENDGRKGWVDMPQFFILAFQDDGQERPISPEEWERGNWQTTEGDNYEIHFGLCYASIRKPSSYIG